jgi:hypothetical protein
MVQGISARFAQPAGQDINHHTDAGRIAQEKRHHSFSTQVSGSALHGIRRAGYTPVVIKGRQR